MGTADEEVGEILDEVIKAGEDLDFLHLLAGLADPEDKKLGGCVCAILTFVTQEAMSVVRGVQNWNGWEAWSLLALRPLDPLDVFAMTHAGHAAEENQRLEGLADSSPGLGGEGKQPEGGARH